MTVDDLVALWMRSVAPVEPAAVTAEQTRVRDAATARAIAAYLQQPEQRRVLGEL